MRISPSAAAVPLAGPRLSGADWVQLAVLSLIWGGSFFFIKVALAEVRAFTIVLSRVAVGALLLNGLLLLRGEALPRPGRLWVPLLVMGFLNNAVPFSLIVWGQTQIDSGLASILNATTPLWTVLLAHVATRDERLTGSRMAGVAVGLAGVVVIMGPDALSGLGSNVLAQVAVLGATVSYAVAALYAKRLKGTAPLQIAAGQLTCSTLLMLPLALLIDRPWTLGPLSAGTLGALVGLGVLSTAVAYVLYFRILASAGSTNAALVTFLIPVSALLLGALVLGERLAPRHLAGMTLIVVGLMVIQGRLTGGKS